MTAVETSQVHAENAGDEVQRLQAAVGESSPEDAVELLSEHSDETVNEVLAGLTPVVLEEVLSAFPRSRRELILAAAPPEYRRQWMRNDTYAEDAIGRLMEPALAVCHPEVTIAEATERLRDLVKRAFITYLFVVDARERLVGVVAMREMLLGRPDQTLEEIMIQDPFVLVPEMELTDAMKATVTRHYPVYPVVDGTQRLIGLLRGQTLFEAQAIELSAQAGTMVGVEKEERLTTHWLRSLKWRHPWLQLNLFTAFIAAAVVGVFEGTIEKIVVLAVFLPVPAGQSGNTGCQALAVTLRGMTLGELRPDRIKLLVGKEAWLGFLNGSLVGLTAGLGMFIYATLQKTPQSPLLLATIVCVAMITSCVLSGVFGAVVPLALKRLGADPATASSIFLTTATDVASMGAFLGLATLFL